MDQRVREAALAGDVGSLQQLLQEDRLILHRPTHTGLAQTSDNPLHIAASLGHTAFVREILAINPDLARAINGHGSSPLHLASANGHLSIVTHLLEVVGSDLCLVRDKDGLLPVHVAVVNGRVRIVEELLTACPESIHNLTSLGDSILHLAVKSNCFETVESLVEKLEENGDFEHLMARDTKGNTILHLATARKQIEILKLLLSKTWADVNALNLKGSTILDVLLESPCEHGDLLLGEMIRAKGGKTTSVEQGQPNQVKQPITPSSSYTTLDISTNRRPLPAWRRMMNLVLQYPLASIGLGYLIGVHDLNSRDYYKTTPDTLLIVSTLITTITFQGGLEPPGGFAKAKDTLAPGVSLKPGQALIADSLEKFVYFDIIALLSSLVVILVLICAVPKWKFLIRILMWITWISFFFMGLAFDQAIFIIFPDKTSSFRYAWNLIAGIFTLWLCIWVVVYLLKKGCWLNNKRRVGDGRKDINGVFWKRLVAGAAIVLTVAVTSGVVYGLRRLP